MMKYLFLTVAFLLFTNYALGCKLGINPTSDFDTTHHIFIGEVVEILESVKYESQGITADAVGLNPKRRIYLRTDFRFKRSCLLENGKKRIAALLFS